MFCNNDTIGAYRVIDYSFYRDHVFPRLRSYYRPQDICGDFIAGDYVSLSTTIFGKNPNKEKQYR